MLVWHRYLAFGSSMDYMYEELHVQYPLTIEVRPLLQHSLLSHTSAPEGSPGVQLCLETLVRGHMGCDTALRLAVLQCRYMGRMDWGRQRWGATLADSPGDYPAASGRLQVSMTRVDRGLPAALPRQCPWLFSNFSQGIAPACRATCLCHVALQGWRGKRKLQTARGACSCRQMAA